MSNISSNWIDLKIINLGNYHNFYSDVLPTYKDGLQLDRILNDDNYCTENFRWVTRKENLRNTRKNVHILHEGVLITIAEFSERLKLDYGCCIRRFRKGLSSEQIISDLNKKAVLFN